MATSHQLPQTVFPKDWVENPGSEEREGRPQYYSAHRSELLLFLYSVMPLYQIIPATL